LSDVKALTPGARNAVLFRAITDSRAACAKVTDSAYQQDYKTMAMFIAHCPGRPPYAVFVGTGGYAR
jgi:hypothetical protein